MKNKINYITGLLCLTGMITLSACGNSDSDVLGTGSFEADEILVSSEVSGKILSWDLTEGTTVEADTPVGLVDTMQLYFQKEALLRSGKAVTSARPNVDTQTAAIKTQLNDLEVQKARTEKLLKADVATQKDLDDINTNIQMLQNQLNAAQSTLTKSSAQITAQSSGIEVQVAQVEDLISRSVITSPIRGMVTANYAKVGELTGAGSPLFRVADLSRMTLRAYLTNDDLAKVQVGQEVTVRVDEGKQMREYTGTVSWISPKAEFTPKTVQTKDERSNLVYAVKVTVENDGYLRIGMYGEIIE